MYINYQDSPPPVTRKSSADKNIRAHWLPRVGSLVVCFILISAIVSVLFLDWEGRYPLAGILICTLLVCSLIAAKYYVSELVISNDKLSYSFLVEKGLKIVRRHRECRLEELEHIIVRRGHFGELLNYGDVSFYGKDDDFTIKYLPEPDKLLRYLKGIG